MKGKALALLTAVGVTFAQPKIKVEDPWIALPPPGPKTTMMGMVVVNEGTEEDCLVAVSTPVARVHELHKTVFENGVARMVRQEKVCIPPGSKVEFKHHGYHVMLIDLKEPLKEGQEVPVKLTFEKSGTLEVKARVKSRHEHQHHHRKKHEGS
ncbi:MAG: copper chaperone PCu(A)C [Aquificae bacterium]|nr:copper chaperone PCu(A)C [Aquificota bacterium]